MAYLFEEFKNIRTFPARTRVYRDGEIVPELSSEEGANLPLHIIRIGKLTGAHNWFVDMDEAGDVFLTARIETEGDTKINLRINPNLENIGFDGKLIIKNTGNLNLEIAGNNNRGGTRIKCQTKLFAAAGGENRLLGVANIPSGVRGAETDISFAALCEPNAFVSMSPRQRISSIPKSAEHSASIYRPAPAQIRYLETAGLTAAESSALLNQTFMEEV